MPLDPMSPGEAGVGSSHDMSLTRVAPDGPAPSLRHRSEPWNRVARCGSGWISTR